MKRRDEEHSKEIVGRFIKQRNPTAELSWVAGETPDYFLIIGDQQYAVEVTTITEPIRLRGNNISLLSIIVAWRRLVSQIEQQMKVENLIGEYAIILYEPLLVWTRKVKTTIKDKILNYVRETQSQNSTLEKVIEINGNQRIIISKSISNRDEGMTRLQMIGPIDWKSVAGIPNAICGLIIEAIKDKKRKLRGMDIPKIIIIRDGYGWGSTGLTNPKTRQDCATKLADNNGGFHTVFIILDNDQGHVLYSECEDWKTNFE